ncbi:STAS domain-containing protein [Streptomyces sp. NPDC004393]
MDDATFKTTVFHTGDSITLAVTGELDLLTGDQLRQTVSECLAKKIRQLVMDLRQVTFCDCGGLNALLWTRRQALTAGVDFVLTGVTTPRVDRVLRLTGTSDLFDLDLRSRRRISGRCWPRRAIAVLAAQQAVGGAGAGRGGCRGADGETELHVRLAAGWRPLRRSVQRTGVWPPPCKPRSPEVMLRHRKRGEPQLLPALGASTRNCPSSPSI